MQAPHDPSNVSKLTPDNIETVKKYLHEAWAGLVTTILNGDMEKFTSEMEFNHTLAHLRPDVPGDKAILQRTLNRIRTQGGYYERMIFWASLSHLTLLQAICLFYETALQQAKESKEALASNSDTTTSSPPSSTDTDPAQTASQEDASKTGRTSAPPSPSPSTKTPPSSSTTPSSEPATKAPPEAPSTASVVDVSPGEAEDAAEGHPHHDCGDQT